MTKNKRVMIDQEELAKLQDIQKKSQKKYKRQNEHIKENYKRASITIKNDVFNIINENILNNGISLNNYINTLIAADIEKYN